MTYAAGTLSIVGVQSNTAQLSSTQATGGVGPYTVQWYRSTTTGFSPGSGNIIAGATSLNLNDSGLVPNTPYYYKVIYTDTGFSNNTVTSSQLTMTTVAAVQSQNQFQQAPFLGQLDLKVGTTNVVSAQIDVTQATALFGGTAVNVVNNTNGIPTVVASANDTDNVFGFIIYDIKSAAYPTGSRCEVAQAGTCIFLYATTAISRGAQVVLDLTSPGSVQAATGSDTVIGWAYDSSPAYGSLIRVILQTPSFTAF